jgi:sulfur-oxidizing protein SoxX
MVAWQSIGVLRALICGAGFAALFATGAAAEEFIAFKIDNNESIAQSLTGKPGDPAAGRKVAINRKQGNCLACHKLPISEQPFHGEIGPDLSTIGDTYSAGELRIRVVNPKIVNRDTFMPAFYRPYGLHRVMKKFQGKTILTAQQVEDVVAYLSTLK